MSLPSRSAKGSYSKPRIGWREWVRLPDLGVEPIKAKVETGARTSSLHVELPLVARRRVRDSSGKAELRPVVETVVEILGQRWPIELTLTRRDSMGFRMLLGRQAIRRRFVVDPGGSFLAGKRVRKKSSSQ